MNLKHVILVALLTMSSVVHAEDLYVIAHRDLSITASEIEDVFTGEKLFAGAVKLIPVENAGLQAAFVDKAIHISLDRYTTLWTKKSFRDGLTPPLVLSGDAEVVSFVKKTPGAIGYVSKPDPTVKTVQKY